MVHYSKVIQGMVNYIDSDIIAQMNGSMRGWGIGIVTGLAAKRAEQLFGVLRNNPIVTALGLVDGEMIDIDAIYSEALRMAQKGSATVSIPILGTVTFKTEDIESVYRHIKGA